ncbi:Ferredoxin OS=Streptomyces alboniger OX=132473 GN=CP975_32625 PE=4 SV=1 [Streptomyces alboniger]
MCARRRIPAEPCHASRLGSACADVCDATFRVLVEQGEHGEEDEERVRVQVEWCRAVCHQCVALCDASPASARCAEACRRCAEACDDFLAAMG